MAALDGLLVVALEQAVAAPYASSRLADAGARVIKIERPEGDFARAYDRAAKGQSAYFVWINRGKESLVLDLKVSGDRALLARMLAKADVFIQNLKPGAAARAGFGSEDLRARHPRLITCDISGYGEDGAWAERKAYDLLVQAETGLAAITGRAEGPGRVGVSVCDIAAGMYAHAAILEALIERGRTGLGKGVKVSLFGALADWMTVPLLQHEGGVTPRRVGLNHPTIAPYGIYAAADGAVVLSVQNQWEWRAFCETALSRPGLADDPLFHDNPARVANRPLLDAAIAAVFAGLSRAELVERLERADIAFGSLNELADLVNHPRLCRQTVETEAGPIDLVAPPAGAQPFRPVPALGAHDQTIRCEFAE